MKAIHSSFLLSFLWLFLGCASSHTAINTGTLLRGKNYTITKHYDEASQTYYFLTQIDHKDKRGRLIQLRHALAEKDTGETVRQLAVKTGAMLAFNASTQRRPTPATKAPSGVQIVDGKIIQDIKTSAYTLGVKANNELVFYRPGTKATEILQDGSVNALTAFIPLIVNHVNADDSVMVVNKHLIQKHPRQVIAQFGNLDLLFLSCGGRGFDGEGMTSKDLMRILQGLHVKFAYMLDGGGSTSTVVGKTLITKKIDEKGTQERTRPDFLYFMPVK